LGLVAVAVVLALITRLDLSPRVEADFFFATDDPQLRTSAAIDELFPSSPQMLVFLAGDPAATSYAEAVGRLSEGLLATSGVAEVYSLTAGPASPTGVKNSPLWRRLLIPGAETASEGPSDGPSGSLVLVELDEETPASQVVSSVEELTAAAVAQESAIDGAALSGVPYVVEQVRRRLVRDLRTFSLVSLLLFGLAVALVFRSVAVVSGTLVLCSLACALTLGALRLLSVPIGLLTANLATIVFVLTLSHLIFLTAAYRRADAPDSTTQTADQRARRAVRETLPASFWCAVTTFLGFASLLFTSARPMRELGLAGMIGTAVALAVAFAGHPTFLRASRPTPAGGGRWSLPPASRGVVIGLGLLTVLAAAGLPRLETDPSLLSYFAPGGELREGLVTLDRSGGSSPLMMVVGDAGGGRFDQPQVADRLAQAQAALEADPAVGTGLSLAVLLEEARQVPLARFLGLPQLLAILDSPAYDQVASGFVTKDRESALIFLRMREEVRLRSQERGTREDVVRRLEGLVLEEGLEPRLVGGLYALQGQLSALVGRSLLMGLGALALLFLGIAVGISRSPRTSAAMVVCLLALPVLIFGTLAWLGRPLDVIASPAANVAIALGIDSMIHLVLARRRLLAEDLGPAAAWEAARRRMAPPILTAALVLAAGFGIFGLSSFPPTRNFGLAVVVGTLAAAALALFALPRLAGADQKPSS
jgi:predicted RND superfamily exporter protein